MAKKPESNGAWLLIERFGHTDEPSVIAIGQTGKTFAPLERIIRSRTHRTVIGTALETIDQAEQPRTIDFTQSGTRYILRPLTDYYGWTPAVQVYYDDEDIAPEPPPACGAWHFNVTTGNAHGSDELLDMYRVPEEMRQTGRPIYEAFKRLVGHDHEAMAKLVEKRVGVTHQAFETVETDEGGRWIAQYSCRFVQRGDEILLHGVTRQVGPYVPGTPAPDPLNLTTQALSMISIPGYYRLIIDPADGLILRAYDGMPPGTPPGSTTLHHLLQSETTAEHALQHLRAVAKSGISLDRVVTTGIVGDEVQARIDPVEVGDKTATMVSFWSPEERDIVSGT